VAELATDRLRGVQPVVAVVGRHVDVGHDDVGPVRTGLAQQLARVGGGRHHVEAGAPQDLRNSLANDWLFVADDDADRGHHIRRAHGAIPSTSVIVTGRHGGTPVPRGSVGRF
jgi:hypothetical protein